MKAKKTTQKKTSLAVKVLQRQKDDYKKIFKEEVRKSKNPRQGAKKAGEIYRSRYGATPTARWKRALKAAK